MSPMQDLTPGSIIAQARLARGLTQREVAQSLDLYTTMLSDMERGTRPVPVDLVPRMVDLLGCPDLAPAALQHRGMAKVLTSALYGPALRVLVLMEGGVLGRLDAGATEALEALEAALVRCKGGVK